MMPTLQKQTSLLWGYHLRLFSFLMCYKVIFFWSVQRIHILDVFPDLIHFHLSHFDEHIDSDEFEF